jgi:hypothetical protein
LSLSQDVGFGDGYLDNIDEDLIVTQDNLADPVYKASIERGTKNTRRTPPGIGGAVLYLSPAKIKKCVAIFSELIFMLKSIQGRYYSSRSSPF